MNINYQIMSHADTSHLHFGHSLRFKSLLNRLNHLWNTHILPEQFLSLMIVAVMTTILSQAIGSEHISGGIIGVDDSSFRIDSNDSFDHAGQNSREPISLGGNFQHSLGGTSGHPVKGFGKRANLVLMNDGETSIVVTLRDRFSDICHAA